MLACHLALLFFGFVQFSCKSFPAAASPWNINKVSEARSKAQGGGTQNPQAFERQGLENNHCRFGNRTWQVLKESLNITISSENKLAALAARTSFPMQVQQ